MPEDTPQELHIESDTTAAEAVFGLVFACLAAAPLFLLLHVALGYAVDVPIVACFLVWFVATAFAKQICKFLLCKLRALTRRL